MLRYPCPDLCAIVDVARSTASWMIMTTSEERYFPLPRKAGARNLLLLGAGRAFACRARCGGHRSADFAAAATQGRAPRDQVQAAAKEAGGSEEAHQAKAQFLGRLLGPRQPWQDLREPKARPCTSTPMEF